jgi:hypothetical protein
MHTAAAELQFELAARLRHEATTSRASCGACAPPAWASSARLPGMSHRPARRLVCSAPIWQ